MSDVEEQALRPALEDMLARAKRWQEMSDEEKETFRAEQLAETQAEVEGARQRAREDRIVSRIEQQIPARWRSRGIEISQLKDWVDRATGGDAQEDLLGLLIVGSIGVGKTGNACAVLRSLLEANYPGDVLFLKFRSLLRALRPRDDEDAAKPRWSMEDVTEAAVLCLDDVGAEKTSEWVEEQLLEIVDTRYDWMRPTIITANLQVPELESRVGARAASRLKETCEIVVMAGPDRRGMSP